jgi:UDP-N-acetylglucosamine--N-acetylmuramyl-(pentapeptide) pyrophosphoryl-undecaprenol N-acetylglucosamine transferase
MSDKIFVIAGRTGGPLLPAMAIAKRFKDLTPIIIGVKGGYEEKYIQGNNYQLEFLPEAKLNILSFSSMSWLEIIESIFSLILMSIKLIYSYFLSVYLLVKYKPRLIISAGSFLAVPIAYAAYITNLLRITKVVIAIHQQDAKLSLSNRLVAPIANKITCYFKTSQDAFLPHIATLMCNPIDTERFDNPVGLDTVNESLIIELFNSDKPKLVVFGGGSGAFAINKWVFENLDRLKERFQVLHLTGVLQDQSVFTSPAQDGYLPVQFLTKSMPYVLKAADLVICRAGMSSITELLYLHKCAFLVPIPNSHQELNARELVNIFPTLRQQFTMHKPGQENWLKTIEELYPNYFNNISYPKVEEIENSLELYIASVQEIISR